jgi:hypothetical protein
LGRVANGRPAATGWAWGAVRSAKGQHGDQDRQRELIFATVISKRVQVSIGAEWREMDSSRERRHAPTIGGKLPTGLETFHKRTTGPCRRTWSEPAHWQDDFRVARHWGTVSLRRGSRRGRQSRRRILRKDWRPTRGALDLFGPGRASRTAQSALVPDSGGRPNINESQGR